MLTEVTEHPHTLKKKSKSGLLPLEGLGEVSRISIRKDRKMKDLRGGGSLI